MRKTPNERQGGITVTTEGPQDLPFWGLCSDCGLRFPIALLPLEIGRFCELMQSARCPRGCVAQVMVPRQFSGQLPDVDIQVTDKEEGAAETEEEKADA